jgi:hypothetical protein
MRGHVLRIQGKWNTIGEVPLESNVDDYYLDSTGTWKQSKAVEDGHKSRQHADDYRYRHLRGACVRKSTSSSK